MDPPAITTQPLPSSENSVKLTVRNLIDSNDQKPTENVVKEDHSEMTAVFDNDGHLEKITEEEKEKRRRRDDDCCCVCGPHYSDDTDVFCLYILCQWMCDCFIYIGQCTEDCFEGCANCISSSCEGDTYCCDCDGADGCGDCFSCCGECCGGGGDCDFST